MMDCSITQNINGLTADSRDVKHGYLFAALQGGQVDGRDYMEVAVKNGATHILAKTGTKFPNGVTGVESDNPRADFAKLASSFYGACPNNIIAITGTNGKTSVADFVRQLLDMGGCSAASIGTLGVKSNAIKIDGAMTTPDPVTLHKVLADLHAADVTHTVMEASSHGLDQYRLDGVNVRVAAFTNLTQDHLDYHGTMDDYFAAKMRLFTDVNQGIAVVNADDVYGQKLLKILPRNGALSYGRGENVDVRLVTQIPTSDGQDIEINFNCEIYKIHLPLIGEFQAYNVLCAAACCIALGFDAKSIFANVSKLQGVNGRMQLAASVNGASAYIDYAHTPDALKNALTSLRPHTNGRLVCVFGAGGNRDKTKRPLMGAVVCDHADIAIITDDNPRGEDPTTIRNEIFSACSMAENIGGRAKAIGYAASILNAGDVLLVAGKGHEQGQTIGKTTHPFDDLTVTRQAMEAYAA